jgi:hypothetical protein
MKLSVVHKIVDSYQKHIPSLDSHWEALYEYPKNWMKAKQSNLSAKEQVLATFKSTRTQRLWKRERYRPIENLIQFYDHDPEWVREGLIILTNTSRPIEDRIDSFRYLTEQMIQSFKKANPNSIIADAHWDMQWISLLLSAMDPTQYAFYHQTLFFRAAQLLDMRPQPRVDNYERYTKMINIIYKFLKDKDLVQQRVQSMKWMGNPSKEIEYKNTAVEALAIYAKVDLFSAPK